MKTLKTGCEYFGGVPALPAPLREALTSVCPTCSHETLYWRGSIPALEAEIAELHARRDKLTRELEAAMATS